MRHITVENKKPDKKWLEKAKELTDELLKIEDEDERIAFINNHQRTWKELKGFLKDLSHGKCWYSEAKDCASYWHVDHFRPKAEIKDLDGEVYEGYWWLAFEWTNYRLSGSAINTPKSSKFPVRPGIGWACSPDDDIDDEEPYLLDPISSTDPGLLTFEEQGLPLALDTQNNWNKERAEVTIDILNLKHESLVQARKQVWFECNNEINKAIHLMQDIQEKISVTKKTKLASAISRIKKMLSEKAPFSTVAVACVQSQGISWLNRMVFMN